MTIQLPDKKTPVPYRVDRYYIEGRGFDIYQRTRLMLDPDGNPFTQFAIGKVDAPLPAGAFELAKFFSIGARLVDFGDGPIPHQFSFEIPEDTLGAAIENWEAHSDAGWKKEEFRIRAELNKVRLR